MKIKSVRARVFEWKGKTVPPQGNFCSNAMDLLYSNQETMQTFRFHGWTVVEAADGVLVTPLPFPPEGADLLIHRPRGAAHQ